MGVHRSRLALLGLSSQYTRGDVTMLSIAHGTHGAASSAAPRRPHNHLNPGLLLNHSPQKPRDRASPRPGIRLFYPCNPLQSLYKTLPSLRCLSQGRHISLRRLQPLHSAVRPPLPTHREVHRRGEHSLLLRLSRVCAALYPLLGAVDCLHCSPK